MVEQIDRDVKRTHPDMHFFSGDTPEAISNQVSDYFFLALLFVYYLKNDKVASKAPSTCRML